MILKHSGETYWKHWIEVIKILWKLWDIFFKLGVHMWIPVLFVRDTSNGIKELNKELQKRIK